MLDSAMNKDLSTHQVRRGVPLLIIPALGRYAEGARIQDQPWLHSKLEASLGYMRPFL